MIELLEDRPVLVAVLGVGLMLAWIGEYVVKRRRGTWVPIRRQPAPHGEAVRLTLGLFMVAIAFLMAWFGYTGFRDDRPGAGLLGVFLTAFSLVVAWMGFVRGRDVDAETQRDVRWRRPKRAYYLASQGVLLAVAVVAGSIGAVRNGNGSWWLLLFCALAIAYAVVFVRITLKMRVQDTRSSTAST